jgi:DNA-binding winged helix-turn-helix (wHTH) protein
MCTGHAVVQAVYRLRRSLGDACAGCEHLIQTRGRLGWRFAIRQGRDSA